MQLIGLRQLNPAPGDYSMIADAFRRLPAEVMSPGQLNRMIGFSAKDSSGKPKFWFLGVKVLSATHIPEGMVAWDLQDHTLTISQSRGDSPAVIESHPITWLWQQSSAADPGQWLGEFQINSANSSSSPAAAQTVTLFANVPYDPQLGALQDEVALTPYDPSWPGQYAQMASWLKKQLGPHIALRIEHYGSTAIPGLSAKPVVDILLEIPSRAQAAPQLLSALCDPRWEYWHYADHDVFIRRKSLMGPREFHIHCAPRGHVIWRGLAFRDYLRTHPQSARDYQQIKESLANQYRNDRETYTQAKTDFVARITALAIQNGKKDRGG